MELRTLLLGAIACGLTTGTATAQAFEKGDNVATFGLGIGGHYGLYHSYTSVTPAIGLAYEHAMNFNVGPGVLGMGGYLGYKSLHARDRTAYYDYDYSWTYIIVGFRSAYHWNTWHEVEKLDTYAGVMLGYNVVTFRDKTDYPDGFTYTGSSASGMGLSGYAGARYYFTDKFGVFGEAGFGIAYLTVGGALKF